MGWRDSVSQAGQDDLDHLVQETLPIAQQFLAKHGEFFPFGLSVEVTGVTRLLAGYEGSEHPSSRDLLTVLYDGLRSRASELRAAAVVSDVRIKNPDGDAIRVEIEHREGVAIAVLLPYRVQRKLLGRQVAYGELQAATADRQIWPHVPDGS